jgi:hypothetical protein
MFVETFRISTNTTIKQLKIAACGYWGLMDRDYDMYKIVNKEKPEAMDEETNQRVAKAIDQLATSSGKD